MRISADLIAYSVYDIDVPSGAMIGPRAGDCRRFVHKRIGRAIGGFIGGGPISAIGGFFGGGGGRKGIPGGGRPGVPGGCSVGMVRDTFGNCVPVSGFGGGGGAGGRAKTCDQLRRGDFRDQAEYQRRCAGAGGEFGQAVMGRYGAALVPAQRSAVTLHCPKGAVLGDDDLCYNRRELRNTDRKWPRGRRPLLTGGEMRAISIANRAAGKLRRNQKRLQAMGMLPKPKAAARQKALPPAKTVVVEHGSGSVVT